MIGSVLRFIAISAVLAIPGPLIFGQGNLTLPALFLFFALALFIPVGLRGVRAFKEEYLFPLHRGLLFYSWIFWAVFVIMGTITIPVYLDPNNRMLIVAFWTVILLLFMALYIGCALGLTYWFKRTKKYVWGSVADVSVLALPIPLVIMGDMLFQDLSNPYVMANMGPMFFSILQFDVYLLIFMVMGTLAIYYFPHYKDEAKPVRLLRILATAFVWLICNATVLYNVQSPEAVSFIVKILPVFTGSLLVYITPLIFEVVVLALAIGIGYYVECGLLRLVRKFKSKS